MLIKPTKVLNKFLYVVTAPASNIPIYIQVYTVFWNLSTSFVPIIWKGTTCLQWCRFLDGVRNRRFWRSSSMPTINWYGWPIVHVWRYKRRLGPSFLGSESCSVTGPELTNIVYKARDTLRETGRHGPMPIDQQTLLTIKAFQHVETLFVQVNQVRTDQNKPCFF